jgi:hypothetical protein
VVRRPSGGGRSPDLVFRFSEEGRRVVVEEERSTANLPVVSAVGRGTQAAARGENRERGRASTSAFKR